MKECILHGFSHFSCTNIYIYLYTLIYVFILLRQPRPLQAYSCFPSTLYPLRVDHMLRAAHSAPVVDLPHRLAMFQRTCRPVKHAAGE